MLGLAHALTLLLGLATTIVWTRWMPLEIYGQFKVVMGIISFAGAFSIIGIGQVALMSASSQADGNLASLIRVKLIGNLVGALLILCAAAYYLGFRQDSFGLVAGLIAAAIFFPFYNINDLWAGWLNGKGQFVSLAVGRLLASALSMCAVVVVVLLSIDNIWVVIAILMTLVSLQNVLMMNKALQFRENEESNNEIVRFGRHMTVAFMFTSVLALDVVFLEYFHAVEDVALYSVALVIPGLLKTIFGIIGQVLAPKIYGNVTPRESWPLLRNKFYWLTLAFGVIGITGFYFIPKLIPLLFTDKYASSGEYAKWLWLIISCSGSFTYLGSTLLATKRALYTYLPNVGHPIILMILYIGFLDFGVMGMILARCISTLLLATYFGVAFRVYISRDA